MPIFAEGKDAADLEEESALCLSVARQHSDPWRKCQWLVEVALHTKDLKVAEKIAVEALDAAREQTQPNRIVSVAVWPINVLALRYSAFLSSVVSEFLAIIADEPHAVRRGDALFLLFEAVYSDPKQRSNLLGLLLQTCAVMNSWKRGFILEDTAVTLALNEPAQMQKIFDSLGESKWSRRARCQIESGYIGPHSFFPYFERLNFKK